MSKCKKHRQGYLETVTEEKPGQKLLDSNVKKAEEASRKFCSRLTYLKQYDSHLWEWDSYDPFQIFEVKHKSCLKLRVHVERAVEITNGWKDWIDTPDPYLVLWVPDTPNGKKRTKTVDNCKNPVWNENFEFLLDPATIDKYYLMIMIMEANYTLDEQMGEPKKIPLNNIKLNEAFDKIVRFENNSRLFLTLHIEEIHQPDLRYSLALSQDEKTYLRERRCFVMDKMKEMFDRCDCPNTPREVPVIGLLGSGGGFRAMTALSGAVNALYDEGIFDLISYFAGISGSTWYISYLYSHHDFPEKSPRELQAELREKIKHHWLKLIPTNLTTYATEIIKKSYKGQPTSFTDLFGHLVADTLLGSERKKSKLSEQIRCLEGGKAPLPLYTCLNVKRNVSAKVFQDWIEFSPFEVGVAKYGAFMNTKHFGNKFFVGKIIKQFEEYPLHFLQGVWGSAFCILLKRLLKDGRTDVDIFRNLNDLPEEPRDRVDSVDEDTEANSDSDLESDDGDFIDGLEYLNISERRKSCADVNGKPKLKREDAFHGEGLNQQVRRRKSSKLGKLQDFWNNVVDSVINGSFNPLNTRALRAGLIFNPLRGLNLGQTFPFQPFNTNLNETDTVDSKSVEEIDFEQFYVPTEVSAKRLYIVDSGLTFNLPFPLLLRPQRGVALYLSFDFSDRASENEPPFKHLLLAEKWSKLNHVLFPPISKQIKEMQADIEKNIKELYIFEDKNNEICPVVLHFVLINTSFRHEKSPGVKRETEEEIDFGNFNVFGESKEYSIYNFCYDEKQFNRLSQLMEYNVKLNIDKIKDEIRKSIKRKIKLLEEKTQINMDDINKLNIPTNEEEVKKFERCMSSEFDMFYDPYPLQLSTALTKFQLAFNKIKVLNSFKNIDKFVDAKESCQ